VRSGFYNQATGNHLDNGQTIRCPVRIGSLWAALSLELDARDMAPMVAESLDHWVTLGRRTMYPNQDYEGRQVPPYDIEADREWFYVYYNTGQRSVGLIRAPKRSIYQTITVLEDQLIPPAGGLSKILEPGNTRFDLHLISSRKGAIRMVIWDPGRNRWVELAPEAIESGQLFILSPVPLHAKWRLRFQPDDGEANVSGWLVPYNP
jgi:hypothetical protein